MRSDLDDVIARNVKLASGLNFGMELLAISANVALAGGMPVWLAFDPGNTNRNVTLYTPAAVGVQVYHKLIHYGTGTGQLVVKDPTGATTLATLDPGASCDLIYVNATVGWLTWIDLGGVAAPNNSSKFIIPLYTKLADLVNTNVLAVAVPYNFSLTSVGFRVRTPATTAAKLATLTGQVNGVAVTGGVVSLTSANATPTNTLVAGTAITAGGAGTAGQTVGVAVSAVTAFVEGDGYVEFGLTRAAAP